MNSSEKSSVVCVISEEILLKESCRVQEKKEFVEEEKEEVTEESNKKEYEKSETVEIESDSECSSGKANFRILSSQNTFPVEKEETNPTITEHTEEEIKDTIETVAGQEEKEVIEEKEDKEKEEEETEKEAIEEKEEETDIINNEKLFLDVSSCAEITCENSLVNSEIEKRENHWKPNESTTTQQILPISNSVSQENESKIDWGEESDQLNINWNKSQIKTCIRIKPMDTQEIINQDNDNLIIQTGPNKILINYEVKGENKKCEFAVDKVFRQESSQMEIWKNISFCIDTLFEFKNATVFAHGHTGTGKTYTMIGPDVMELIKKKKKKTRSVSKKVQTNEILLNTNSLKMSNGTTSGSTKQNLPNTQVGIHRKRSCSQPILILPSKFQPLNNINSLNYKRTHHDTSNAITTKLHGNYKLNGNTDSSNECNYYTKHENYKTFEEYINDTRYYVRTNHEEVDYVLNSEKKGMIPRACEEIMKRLEKIKFQQEQGQQETVINEMKEQRNSYINNNIFKNVKVYASYMQLYNDRIFDLLNPYTESQPILNTLKSNFVNNTTFVSGLLTVEVNSVNQLIELLIDGTCNRACRITKTNEMSTRSHSIFKIELKNTDVSSKNKNACGNLLLIDLAGNEKYEATNEKLYSTEVCSINRSLSALSLCINELSRGNKSISYRNSILTRLLQGSLGGSSKTVFICTVSSCLTNVRDTISSLQLAAKAKKVQIENKKLQSYLNEDAKKLRRELNFLKKFVFFQYITNKYENRKRFQKMKNYLMNQLHKKTNIYNDTKVEKKITECENGNGNENTECLDPLDNVLKTKEESNHFLIGPSEEIFSEEKKHVLRTCEGLEQIYHKCEFSSFGSLLSQWDMNKSSIKKVQWKGNEKNNSGTQNKKDTWFTTSGNINRYSILDFIETHTIEYEMETDDEFEKDSFFYDSDMEFYNKENKKELEKEEEDEDEDEEEEEEEDEEEGDEEEEVEEEEEGESFEETDANGSRVKSLLKKMVIEKKENAVFSGKEIVSSQKERIENKEKRNIIKKKRKGKNKNIRKEKSSKNTKKTGKLMKELQEELKKNSLDQECMQSNRSNLLERKERKDRKKEIQIDKAEMNKKPVKQMNFTLQKNKMYNSFIRKKGTEDPRGGSSSKKKQKSLLNKLTENPEESEESNFDSFEFSHSKDEYKSSTSRCGFNEAMLNKSTEHNKKKTEANDESNISEYFLENSEEEKSKDKQNNLSSVNSSHNKRMKELMNQLNRFNKYHRMIQDVHDETIISKKKYIKNKNVSAIGKKKEVSSNELEKNIPGAASVLNTYCVSSEYVNPRTSIKNIGINNLVINKIKEREHYKESLEDETCISELKTNLFRKSVDKSSPNKIKTKRIIGLSPKERMMKTLERKRLEMKNKEKEECMEGERGRSISESAYYSTLKNKTIIGKNNKGKFTYYIEFENALASNEIRKESFCKNRKRVTTNIGNPKSKNGKMKDVLNRNENGIASSKKSKEFLLTDIEKSWLNFERKLEHKLKKSKVNKELNSNQGMKNINDILYDEFGSREEPKETYDILSVIQERKSKLDGIKNKYNQLYLDVKTKGKNLVKPESKETVSAQTKSQGTNSIRQEEKTGKENRLSFVRPIDIISKDIRNQDINEYTKESIGKSMRGSITMKLNSIALHETTDNNRNMTSADVLKPNKNNTTNLSGGYPNYTVEYMKSKELNQKNIHSEGDPMKIGSLEKANEVDYMDPSVHSFLHNSNQSKKESIQQKNVFIPNEQFHCMMQKGTNSKTLHNGFVSNIPLSLEKQGMFQKSFQFSSPTNEYYARNGMLGRNEIGNNTKIYYRYPNMKAMNPFVLNKEISMRDLYTNHKTDNIIYPNGNMGNNGDKYIDSRYVRINELGEYKGKEPFSSLGMTGFSTKKMHKLNFFYVPESNEKNSMNNTSIHQKNPIDTNRNNNRRNTISIDNDKLKKGNNSSNSSITGLPKSLPQITKNSTAGNVLICNNSNISENMKNTKHNTNENHHNKIKNSMHYSNTVDLVKIQPPLSMYINSNHMEVKDTVPLNIYSRNPIIRNFIKTEENDFDKNFHSGVISEMNKRYTAPLELFR